MLTSAADALTPEGILEAEPTDGPARGPTGAAVVTGAAGAGIGGPPSAPAVVFTWDVKGPPLVSRGAADGVLAEEEMEEVLLLFAAMLPLPAPDLIVASLMGFCLS